VRRVGAASQRRIRLLGAPCRRTRFLVLEGFVSGMRSRPTWRCPPPGSSPAGPAVSGGTTRPHHLAPRWRARCIGGTEMTAAFSPEEISIRWREAFRFQPWSCCRRAGCAW